MDPDIQMQDAENNIECDSPEATVLKLIKSHENEDQGDTRRAFQKMLVEMQELRDSYGTLRAEHYDRSAGWAEQGPAKAREEVLLNQIQQLEERLKQFEAQSGWSDDMPARESSDRAVISSNEIFSGLLKMYLDDKRIPQNNDSADADVVLKAGVAAQRRRSQCRSGRNSYSASDHPSQFVDPTRSSDGRGDQHVQDGCTELAREVRGLPPIWLLALFRNQRWRKFSEVVRLLEKEGGQTEFLFAKMTEEAFHAYVNSKDFQNDFQKLMPLLQQTALSITEASSRKLSPMSSTIKDRHSVPNTVMTNVSQRMDAEQKRPSSLSSHILL